MGTHKHVHLTPTEPMYIEGRKVIKITCEMNQSDINARAIKLYKNRPTTAVPIKCSNGKIYPSIKTAAYELGINRIGISKTLRGLQESTHGLKFTYQ